MWLGQHIILSMMRENYLCKVFWNLDVHILSIFLILNDDRLSNIDVLLIISIFVDIENHDWVWLCWHASYFTFVTDASVYAFIIKLFFAIDLQVEDSIEVLGIYQECFDDPVFYWIKFFMDV